MSLTRRARPDSYLRIEFIVKEFDLHFRIKEFTGNKSLMIRLGKADDTRLGKPCIDIMNAFEIPRVFEDEFKIKECIAKICPPVKGEFGSIYVQVFKQGFSQAVDHTIDFDDAVLDRDKTKVERVILNFIKGTSEDIDIKELKFIYDAGLPKEIAANIDVDKRIVIEKMFPVLRKYNGLCFKGRATTMRRMLVFPQRANYRQYIEDMKSLMSEVNGKYYEQLHSRVMVSFKGKYVLRIDSDIFECFKEEIENRVSEAKLSMGKSYQINRVDLSLFSSQDTMKTLMDCVNDLMKLLETDVIELAPDLLKFGLYPITSKHGVGFFEFINQHSKFFGKVHFRFEKKTQQILLNGVEELKNRARELLDEW